MALLRIALDFSKFDDTNFVTKPACFKLLTAVFIKTVAGFLLLSLACASTAAAQGDYPGYKPTAESESEFDNKADPLVKDWRAAGAGYRDTEFGENIYNEASIATKLEILRLLSKDTPSTIVFMHAISMGLGIEDVLQASVKYEPAKGRELAASAVSLLPLMPESDEYRYSSYELEDLERRGNNNVYAVNEVVENFFEGRKVLRPYPDWYQGQFHFMASAAELKALQAPKRNIGWYKTKAEQPSNKRPVFVSLYAANESVLIDSQGRIEAALKTDPNAKLPVVFIFNRSNERALDELGYPKTIRGVRDAYQENALMLTPAPEWQLGEYHLYASLDEIHELFDIPAEQDFEPEAWQKLISEAKQYSVADTSFLFVVTGSGKNDTARVTVNDGQLYAAWDNPRTEENYKYIESQDGLPVTLKNIMSKGVIFNRPDLIAALQALEVKEVPVVFYYIDGARVRPFNKSPRVLIQAAVGTGAPIGSFGAGSGGFTAPQPVVCPSPPCS